MNKTKFYIIPGYNETTRRKAYIRIAELAEKKGYNVVKINPDWSRSFTEQIFEADRCDIVFAFSLGGVLALINSFTYPCKKIILASSTTHLCADLLSNVLPAEIIDDIKKTKKANNKGVIRLYGELEKSDAIKYLPKSAKIKEYIPKTGHSLSDNYIQIIAKYL